MNNPYENGLRMAYQSILGRMVDLDSYNKDTYIEDMNERWDDLKKSIQEALKTTHKRLDVKEDQNEGV